ncbi:MAG: hypothetical protein IJW16_03330, partial [Clostridia bacterium]|nr:hypothetical protein [Clostridia bacterium]
AETKAPVMEQISAFDPPYTEDAPVAAPAEEPAKEEAPAQPKAPKSSKSRVGSMFDLLTFSDV